MDLGFKNSYYVKKFLMSALLLGSKSSYWACSFLVKKVLLGPKVLLKHVPIRSKRSYSWDFRLFNFKPARPFLCFLCNFQTLHQGERKLHCSSWKHQMNEYFALQFLKPHQCYFGQSSDYISTVDTEKFEFKLVISKENFLEEIEKNKKRITGRNRVWIFT